MSEISLWLYKGNGTRYDSMIRWWTKSTFSHVELCVDGLCYSSSPRDGGVRSKTIELTDNWDVIPIWWADELLADDIKSFYYKTVGSLYDSRGIIFSQVFNANRHNAQKYFCSEWCLSALGLEPTLLNPGQAGQLITSLNSLYQRRNN
jgi:hypothetical protein